MAEKFRKRIEKLFEKDAHVRSYRECLNNVGGSSFVEFELIGSENLNATLKDLLKLSKLTGSQEISVAGWYENACFHTDASGQPVLFITIYDV
jgi:hypothetical protein